MDVKQMIGARIKGIRAKKRISQERLAERMEINPKYLSSIERGKENPTLNTLIKLSESLEVDLGEIFLPSRNRGSCQKNVPYNLSSGQGR